MKENITDQIRVAEAGDRICQADCHREDLNIALDSYSGSYLHTFRYGDTYSVFILACRFVQDFFIAGSGVSVRGRNPDSADGADCDFTSAAA